MCGFLTPTGTGRFDENGDGKDDYYKMIDAQNNEYYIYWLSRKSPYLTYDNLLRRAQSGWTDVNRVGLRSSMASDTCLMQDAEVISYTTAGGDVPAQSAESDTLAYELDWFKRMSEPIPYAWNKAGDQYSLLAFGNVIKVNGGELPPVGLRIKMGTCYRRCYEDSRPGHTCATDTGFLPTQGVDADIGVSQDVSALCSTTTATQ